MYAYAAKDEIKIYRYLSMDCLKEAMANLRADCQIIVEAEGVVGTAGNFVTRNDKVYDLDYAIVLLKAPSEYAANPDLLHQLIEKEFDAALADKFDKVPGMPLALRYVHHAKKSGLVNFQLDLTIVKRDEGDEERLYEADGHYRWSEPFNRRFLRIQEETIKDWDQWQDLRDEYLRLKNASLGQEGQQLSVDLYRQAVANIYG
ncbi:MAG: hypothetical protein SOH68_03515 [Lactobacillus sp.]|jgi:hypothetical protein|uniref:hypothetical protein n=1 Tax=Lactobacillus porci TaxID=2012477 RepID=UPI002F3D8E36